MLPRKKDKTDKPQAKVKPAVQKLKSTANLGEESQVVEGERQDNEQVDEVEEEEVEEEEVDETVEGVPTQEGAEAEKVMKRPSALKRPAASDGGALQNWDTERSRRLHCVTVMLQVVASLRFL